MILTAHDVTFLVFFEHRLLDLNSFGFLSQTSTFFTAADIYLC